MRNYRSFLVGAALGVLLLGAASCGGDRARIDGELTGAPSASVEIKCLNVNRLETLDVVKTSRDGHYSYTVKVAPGDPEFVYVYYGDTKVASLLLSAGDRVQVVSDTLGRYTVTGSEESARLREVEEGYAVFSGEVSRLLAEGAAGADIQADLSRLYVRHYRDRVKYVLDHPHSLTVVPVLYEELVPGTPIFSRETDALHFRAAADSLKAVYPASRYVRALEGEAERRSRQMDLGLRLQNAEEMSYVDIDLPDLQGERVKLSAVGARVVMVYFWSTADAAQKMFNLDSVLPVYREFHPRGLEIYAVSLDADKAAWAAAIRGQELPWINVCDGRGASSPYVGLYGLRTLPTAYFIVDGELVTDADVTDTASLRRYLSRIL